MLEFIGKHVVTRVTICYILEEKLHQCLKKCALIALYIICIFLFCCILVLPQFKRLGVKLSIEKICLFNKFYIFYVSFSVHVTL